MPTPHEPSNRVRRALRKLGEDIKDARRLRGLTMTVVAERAFTSRSTLQRIEEGNHNVSIGIYAQVLYALGLLDGMENAADIATDIVGRGCLTNILSKVRGTYSTNEYDYHYTYQVKHKPSNREYIGVRSCNILPAEDLWNEYFTSSKEISDLIDKGSEEDFEIVFIREYSSRKEANAEETRLREFHNVSNNHNFINLA